MLITFFTAKVQFEQLKNSFKCIAMPNKTSIFLSKKKVSITCKSIIENIFDDYGNTIFKIAYVSMFE